MSSDSLRAALRHHTEDSHRRIDTAIGEFGGVDQYRVFVVNSYRFRGTVEPGCSGIGLWPVPPLFGLLARDLRDLGVETLPAVRPPMRLPSHSAALGALYVLEGSALGARLLLRRVAALGFDGRFGARHLAAQVADTTRWCRFLRLLETETEINRAEVLAAAAAVFERATECYTENASERV